MNISRSYVRRQIQNIPSDTWLLQHTKDKQAYMDPRILFLLEDDYDRILRLVVGNRWQATDPKHWPRLIRRNTRLYGEEVDIRDTEDVDSGLSKVREWWDRRGKYVNVYAEALRRDRGW